MDSVTKSMSGCRIASSTSRSYHLGDAISRSHRLLAAVPLQLRGPEAPDREPDHVHRPYADHPQRSGEEPGQHVRRIMDPEVEPAEADQEHQQHAASRNGPPRQPPQSVGQDERQRPVKPDRDGGVSAGERVEGRRVARVDQPRPRPLKDGLEYGGEEYAAGGRDEEQDGGEPPALEEEENRYGQERQHDPVVAQSRD